MQKFTPRLDEMVEINRRVVLARMNFAIYSLQGMLNTTRHIISPLIGKKDAVWFEHCIEYMLFKVREEKEKLKRRK